MLKLLFRNRLVSFIIIKGVKGGLPFDFKLQYIFIYHNLLLIKILKMLIQALEMKKGLLNFFKLFPMYKFHFSLIESDLYQKFSITGSIVKFRSERRHMVAEKVSIGHENRTAFETLVSHLQCL